MLQKIRNCHTIESVGCTWYFCIQCSVARHVFFAHLLFVFLIISYQKTVVQAHFLVQMFILLDICFSETAKL
jgi:hypothetical protein